MKLLHLTRSLIPIALLASGVVAISSAQAEPQVLDGGPGSTVCPNSITGGIFIAGCLPSVKPPASKVDLRGPDQVATLCDSLHRRRLHRTQSIADGAV